MRNETDVNLHQSNPLMPSISYDSASTVDCPSLSALRNHLSREPLIQKRLHNPYNVLYQFFQLSLLLSPGSHLALNNNTIHE